MAKGVVAKADLEKEQDVVEAQVTTRLGINDAAAQHTKRGDL